jgi:hypothetical protein
MAELHREVRVVTNMMGERGDRSERSGVGKSRRKKLSPAVGLLSCICV